MEYLDVIDENGNKTGATVSYEEAHEKGVMHRVVHVWFLNSQNQLLLQKRSATKRAYPNQWDISAAGHISAGETSMEAARKEIQEEIGLDIPEEKIQYLFTVEEHVVLNEGTFVANEFQDVYLVRMDLDPSSLTLQTEEVADVRWVDIIEFKSWMEGKGESLVPHGEEHQRLIAFLEK